MINILITSYNDVDINNTINSIIDNASGYYILKIKILFIGDVNISHKFNDNLNIEIYNIKRNRGVGYSRKLLTTKLPKNEYFLQIDSHHRFVKNWDKILFNDYNELKSKYNDVVISTTLPHFEDGFFSKCKSKSFIGRYTKNGVPIIDSKCSDIFKETGLITAHFLFGETSFFENIKYKDTWYFMGEEILLSIYAFKFGYKVFNLKEIIAWHKYNTTNNTQRDLIIEKKTYKHILNEMMSIYNEDFINLIGFDIFNFKTTKKNYFIHGATGFDLIHVLTPNNEKITLYNTFNEDILKFSADGFFKGAILYDTINNKKKYFSLTT